MVTAPDYRMHVGPADGFDRMAAMQFNLLTHLGLREHHDLLDIGCGSLRAGRLFIPYLLPGRYCGLEPEEWLVNDGIVHEVGRSQIEIKHPTFDANRDFKLTAFGRQFDFLIAQSIFSHTSVRQMEACLSEARAVMRPQAMFVASYFPGEDYEGDSWTIKATYRFERIEALARAAGLSCTPLDWPHSDFQEWLLFTHPDQAVDRSELTSSERMLQLESALVDMTRQRDQLLNHPWTRLGMRLHLLKMLAGFKAREVMRTIRRKS
ncbi:MAG: class I SAM-dependent methyltransferase [Hyphomicrobiaceae bacterium]